MLIYYMPEISTFTLSTSFRTQLLYIFTIGPLRLITKISQPRTNFELIDTSQWIESFKQAIRFICTAQMFRFKIFKTKWYFGKSCSTFVETAAVCKMRARKNSYSKGTWEFRRSSFEFVAEAHRLLADSRLRRRRTRTSHARHESLPCTCRICKPFICSLFWELRQKKKRLTNWLSRNLKLLFLNHMLFH